MGLCICRRSCVAEFECPANLQLPLVDTSPSLSTIKSRRHENKFTTSSRSSSSHYYHCVAKSHFFAEWKLYYPTRSTTWRPLHHPRYAKVSARLKVSSLRYVSQKPTPKPTDDNQCLLWAPRLLRRPRNSCAISRTTQLSESSSNYNRVSNGTLQ